MKRIPRTAAAIVVALLMAVGLSMLNAPAATAAGQDFSVTSSCTYRVSGFQDYGKAAASNRDQSSCTYLMVELKYGTAFQTWTSTKGPTLTDYLKTNAGYYDWKRAGGAVSNNNYVWNYIWP